MGEGIALTERSVLFRLAVFRNRWAAHDHAAEPSTSCITVMRVVDGHSKGSQLADFFHMQARQDSLGMLTGVSAAKSLKFCLSVDSTRTR
jgi:hypothetical protein